LHKELDFNDLIDFYSVFAGFNNTQKFQATLFESIEELFLKNYSQIQNYFDFDQTSSYALMLLAKNSRKFYSINRKIKHFKALSIMRECINLGILKLEKSQEPKQNKNKRQKIKKQLRNYVIQDKIIFKNHFTRFFFRFLKPNENLILQGNFQIVLEKIKENFQSYQSFCFEQLSREFLEKKFNIYPVQSYWDQKLELDLYYSDENFTLIGEVKFKNKKICKNILNELENKAKKLNLNPNYYILFSKNGFSKELNKTYKNNLLLYDLYDLKFLLKDHNE